MNKKRFLTISVLFIWCIIDVMNFVVSIYLFIEDKKAYPIIFWSFYGLEKIIVIILSITQRSKASIRFALLDTVSLGFITPIFQFIELHKIIFILIAKAVTRGIVFFLQLIFFFGIKILNDDIQNSIVNTAYASYIFYLIMQGITFEMAQSQNQQNALMKVKRCVVSQLVYYITLSGLATLYDNFDVNLGYYFILITGLQQIMIGMITDNNKTTVSKQSVVAFMNIVFNYHGFKQNPHVRKYFIIFNYMFQLIRFILFLCFVDKVIDDDNYHLKNINNVAVIVINIIYFIVFFRVVIKQAFEVNIIHINNINNFKNTYKKFKANKFYYFNKVYVYFINNIAKDIKNESTFNTKEQPACTNELCEMYYDLNKIQSDKSSHNFKLELDGFSQLYCEFHLNQSLKINDKINYWIFFQLQKYIQKHHEINKVFMSELLLERYMNGHILNSNNPNLFNHIKTTTEKRIFKQLESCLLQISAFNNQFSQISTKILNHPQNILFDLYSS